MWFKLHFLAAIQFFNTAQDKLKLSQASRIFACCLSGQAEADLLERIPQLHALPPNYIALDKKIGYLVCHVKLNNLFNLYI